MKVFRQGDVVIKEVENPIEILKNISEENKVSDSLSIGGETGKLHQMQVPVYNVGGQTVIILDHPENLEHEEHHKLEIPAGIYTVYRVRDYFKDGFD
ncbi:MAG: hypothetical protein QW124_06575 [Thermoplasmata archaeon]